MLLCYCASKTQNFTKFIIEKNGYDISNTKGSLKTSELCLKKEGTRREKGNTQRREENTRYYCNRLIIALRYDLLNSFTIFS